MCLRRLWRLSTLFFRVRVFVLCPIAFFSVCAGHRQGNEVFSVNGICFHPNGTFATVGGDGVFTTWDKDSKQRLKLSAAQGNSVTCAAFNPAGTIFAY